MKSFLVLLIALSLPVSGCAAPPPPTVGEETESPSIQAQVQADPDENLEEGCVDNFDPAVDYFPEKVEVARAVGFSVEYQNHYKVVTVTSPWQGAEESFRYLLVLCGTPIPEGVEGEVIQIPADEIIALSTTYLPHLETLGVLDRLVAIDSFLWATTESVREKIEADSLAEVGSGSTINVERVLELDPDLVMAFGLGVPEYDTHPVLIEAGVPVVLNGDFAENDPLGRTEWIKFLALFFNREAEAVSFYSEVVDEYERVAALAGSVEERPTVFLGSVFSGTWWMPGGNSYTAHILEDAGADFLWADTDTVASNPYEFEAVLDRAVDADFWLNQDNAMWMKADDVLASDERYGEFRAFQEGRAYNNNGIVNENGGSGFFEAGAANPHIVLKDLVSILHPDLLPDHEPVFYRSIE